MSHSDIIDADVLLTVKSLSARSKSQKLCSLQRLSRRFSSQLVCGENNQRSSSAENTGPFVQADFITNSNVFTFCRAWTGPGGPGSEGVGGGVMESMCVCVWVRGGGQTWTNVFPIIWAWRSVWGLVCMKRNNDCNGYNCLYQKKEELQTPWPERTSGFFHSEAPVETYRWRKKERDG